MTDPERGKIYVPTEAEVDAISGFEPGDRLVEYYSAAERLRIGYLATKYERYNEMIAGPMQYAGSERLAALGGQVVEILNTSFEEGWDGAYITVGARDDKRIMTKIGAGNSSPYPQKEYLVNHGQLRFRGEGFRTFNNYHNPDRHPAHPLDQLKFYQFYGGGDNTLYAPIVQLESGEPCVSVRFVGQETPGSRQW